MLCEFYLNLRDTERQSEKTGWKGDGKAKPCCNQATAHAGRTTEHVS